MVSNIKEVNNNRYPDLIPSIVKRLSPSKHALVSLGICHHHQPCVVCFRLQLPKYSIVDFISQSILCLPLCWPSFPFQVPLCRNKSPSKPDLHLIVTVVWQIYHPHLHAIFQSGSNASPVNRISSYHIAHTPHTVLNAKCESPHQFGANAHDYKINVTTRQRHRSTPPETSHGCKFLH